MKKIILITLNVLIFSFCAAQTPSAVNAHLLEEKFDELTKKYPTQGISVAVSLPDGSTWSSARGKYGNTDIKTSDLFEFGSNTKTFTAATIYQLCNEGKLNLDDTLYQYLNIIPNVPYGITIRQLINHTSGLYSFTASDDYFDMVEADITQVHAPDTILSFIEKPTSKIGEKFEYCNTGYTLLGMIIEQIEGKPYHQVIRNRFIQPLKMESTFMAGFESHTLNKAGGYFRGDYYPDEFTSFMSTAYAAGGMLSTSSDMAYWARSLFGGDILTDSFLTIMQTIQSGTTTSPLTFNHGSTKSRFYGVDYYGHGGKTLFFHSEMYYSTKSKFGYASVVNSDLDQARQGVINKLLLRFIEEEMKFILSNPKPQLSMQDIYPNPTSKTIHIKANSNFDTYTIRSLDGKTLIESNLDAIDVSSLKPGVYLIAAQKNKQLLSTLKFVKQ